MRYAFILLGITYSFIVQAVTIEQIQKLAKEIEAPLKSARYMEENCQAFEVENWKGFDTQKCSYKVKGRNEKDKKSGLVVLLDPDPVKLSTWILYACETEWPERMTICPGILFQKVLTQSGGQFPIAGVVYEDIIPADGVQEAYGFTDGVTTIQKEFNHRRTEPFSENELEATVAAHPIKTASESAPARLAGTTREAYKAFSDNENIKDLNWPAIVRFQYQKAMKSDHNSLLEAWLRANKLAN